MKTVDTCMMVLLLFLALTVSSCSALMKSSFGGKSGDWAEYELQDTFGAGQQSVRMEFLSVEGTNVTVNAAIYATGMMMWNETKTIDLTSRDDLPMDPWFSERVYFVPAGLSVGDPVYLGQAFGTLNITGETTENYAGADRTIVYANFAQQGYAYVFYWDKQTGVLAEGVETRGGIKDVFLSNTNMWGADFPWWLWAVVAVVIALGVLSSRKSIMKKLRRETDAKTSATRIASFPRRPGAERLIEVRGFI